MSAPRIGVLSVGVLGLPDRVRESGGEPVSIAPFPGRPKGGVALAREWIADVAQISCASEDLDGLMVADEAPEVLAGFLISALRLDLPTVVAPTSPTTFGIVAHVLGVAPLAQDAAEVAVAAALRGGPRPGELVQSFSLANAVRAGCALDGGPELLVHLAAIAREAGAQGFSQMVRVLGARNPRRHDPARPLVRRARAGWSSGLSRRGHQRHADRGRQAQGEPARASNAPTEVLEVGSRLAFVEGRASGVEALCRVEGPETEVAGTCRVFGSDEEAARAVE